MSDGGEGQYRGSTPPRDLPTDSATNASPSPDLFEFTDERYRPHSPTPQYILEQRWALEAAENGSPTPPGVEGTPPYTPASPPHVAASPSPTYVETQSEPGSPEIAIQSTETPATPRKKRPSPSSEASSASGTQHPLPTAAPLCLRQPLYQPCIHLCRRRHVKGPASKKRKHTDALETYGKLLQKCRGFFPEGITRGEGIDAAVALYSYLVYETGDLSTISFWKRHPLPKSDQVRRALILLSLDRFTELIGFMVHRYPILSWLKDNNKITSISRTLLVNFILGRADCGDTNTVMQETLSVMGCPLLFAKGYDPRMSRCYQLYTPTPTMTIPDILKELASTDERVEEDMPLFRHSECIETSREHTTSGVNPYIVPYSPTSPSYRPTTHPLIFSWQRSVYNKPSAHSLPRARPHYAASAKFATGGLWGPYLYTGDFYASGGEG